MARTSFDDSLRRLLAHEGGYVNHPADPGGPTNFGITLTDYRRHVKPDASAADVRAMRLEEAAAIYREKYWNALACDALPAGVDYSLFDYGVNSGTGRAGRVLRRVCGLPDDDWRVTDEVRAAAMTRDPRMLIAAINDERLAFLRRLSIWPVFGKGWARRVAEVRAASLAMTSNPLSGDAGAGPVTPPVKSNERRATKLKILLGAIVAVGAALAHRVADIGIVAIIALAATTIAILGAAHLAWRWRKSKLRRHDDNRLV